jgi:hypothetical protein
MAGVAIYEVCYLYIINIDYMLIKKVMLAGYVDTIYRMDNKSIYLFSNGIQIWCIYYKQGNMVEQTLYISPIAGSMTKLICNEAYACIRIIGFIYHIEDNMYI